MGRYRLEWPGEREGDVADLWSLEPTADAARRTVARMLVRRRHRVPWVRVVRLGPDGDVADAFVTAATICAWASDAPLPDTCATMPTAAPEIERLRARALAALDVVLTWARSNEVITVLGAEHVRLVFDGAMLGVVVETGEL